MKFVSLLLLTVAAPVFADFAADRYVNFVRQVHADGSGEWDMSDLEPQGERTSFEGVGDLGSDYELWSVQRYTGQMYLLDSQFVAAFSPTATFSVYTRDPYPDVYRTRADKGFTLFTDVEGLASASEVTADTPAAVQKVVYEHKTYTYPDGTSSLEGQDVSPEVIEQLYINGNGPYPSSSGRQDFGVTNIPSGDLTQAHGEEHFTISALADHGVLENVVESVLVQIWPVASGSIDGLDDTSELMGDVPPLSISINDLYPSSTTWVQVFPGATGDAVSEDEMLVVSDSVFVWDEAISTNRTLTVSDLGDLLTQHGLHTIQLVHETPWGLEVLDEKQFSVNRTVRMRGTLITR